MADDVVTTGELGRRLDRFENTITNALGGFSTKLDDRPDWQDVRRIEANLEGRIKKLEEWQTWALRLGGPALIAAVGGMLVNASRMSS